MRILAVCMLVIISCQSKSVTNEPDVVERAELIWTQIGVSQCSYHSVTVCVVGVLQNVSNSSATNIRFLLTYEYLESSGWLPGSEVRSFIPPSLGARETIDVSQSYSVTWNSC